MNLQRHTTVSIVTSTPVDADHPLVAAELARAAGDRLEWVFELVEAGVIEPTEPSLPRAQWAFHSEALRCALETRRLQRDFDVNLDAAALILDLQREIRRLRSLAGLATRA
jgi:chaperone modulatory protein CbpM